MGNREEHVQVMPENQSPIKRRVTITFLSNFFYKGLENFEKAIPALCPINALAFYNVWFDKKYLKLSASSNALYWDIDYSTDYPFINSI